MNFNEEFPEWKNQGTEPSETLKTNGYEGGYKPPASVFNWFWSKVMRAITELQTKLSGVDDSKADKQTASGGFVGGSGAEAQNGGVAIGKSAYSNGRGGAVGQNARAYDGGAVGTFANAQSGGAIGYNARTGAGFAGGYNAKTVDDNGSVLDAVQLGTGTNSTPKTLKVYEYPLMDADGKIPAERLANAPKTMVEDVLTSTSTANALSANMGKQLSDTKADQQTAQGGFAGGENAAAAPGEDGLTNGKGAAVGSGASGTDGGAVGKNAQENMGGFAGGAGAKSDYGGGATGKDAQDMQGGFAGGNSAYSDGGAAVGNSAQCEGGGGAVGFNAEVQGKGGAVGYKAYCESGGAVGDRASTGAGFAGGYNAKTVDDTGSVLDAVQLGMGTNSVPKTLQVYSYQLMGADGKIPVERTATSSDERLKEGIEAADGARLAAFVDALEVVGYRYKGEKEEHVGLVAQQVQAADAELARHVVLEGEDGYLMVRPEQLVYPLVAAVQQLRHEVDSLKKMLDK